MALTYLEGIADGERFLEAVRRLTARKPLVLVKGGVAAAGQRAARSHTGSLATDDRVFDGVCRQLGALRAPSVEAAYEWAATLATQPLPRGRRVVVFTTAGGWGVLAADACAAAGLELIPLPDSVRERIDSLVPARWSRNNPIDLAGGETRDTIPEVIDLVCAHPDVDAVIHLGIGIQAAQANVLKSGPFFPDFGLERIVAFPRAPGPTLRPRRARSLRTPRQARPHGHGARPHRPRLRQHRARRRQGGGAPVLRQRPPRRARPPRPRRLRRIPLHPLTRPPPPLFRRRAVGTELNPSANGSAASRCTIAAWGAGTDGERSANGSDTPLGGFVRLRLTARRLRRLANSMMTCALFRCALAVGSGHGSSAGHHGFRNRRRSRRANPAAEGEAQAALRMAERIRGPGSVLPFATRHRASQAAEPFAEGLPSDSVATTAIRRLRGRGRCRRGSGRSRGPGGG